MTAIETPVLTHSLRTRRSPYYDATLAAGARGFTVYNRMVMPTVYRSPEEDYWPLINAVSMWDVSVERQVELTGPDAMTLATLLTPRDISGTKIGQCKYVPIVDDGGGMINDPVLLRLADDHLWLSIADADVLLWAKGVADARGLDVRVIEPDVSPLAVQGPRAEDVVADLLGDWVRAVRFFWFAEHELEGIPLVVARSGWSKQGGFELYLRDGTRGTELWERVAAAGSAYGIAPGSPSQMERIESGLLSYGNDMTLDDTPFHVGLDRYCALDQEAEFIGKAALRAIQADGVRRSLNGIEIAGDRIDVNISRWPVTDGAGSPVGAVTSATWSPRLERNIALAMLSHDHSEPGAQLVVDVEGERRSATVVGYPFVS